MAHRQTNMQENTQTDMLIAILCHPYLGESEKNIQLTLEHLQSCSNFTICCCNNKTCQQPNLNTYKCVNKCAQSTV